MKLATGMLREAAALTSQIGGEVIPSDVPGSLAMAYRQPAGVVFGIAPWNAPIILGVRAVAMPLACGNTVVLKSSEVCPATHRLIGTVLREAGFGDGVVNVISTRRQGCTGRERAVIGHPAVKRVNFTGSTRVGRVIAELVPRNILSPCCSSWAARRRCWCSPTPISMPRSTPRCSARSQSGSGLHVHGTSDR